MREASIDKVTNPRVIYQQGYPLLLVDIDGETARLGTDQKLPLVEQGIIFLGPTFQERVPEIRLPANEAEGRAPLTLRGFTRDERIVELYRAFRRALSEGEVPEGPFEVRE